MIIGRHGESTGDIDCLLGGTYDDDLTIYGQRQALDRSRDLAARFKLRKLFSSNLKRAKQTANIYKEQLEIPKVGILPDFRECNRYGSYSGKHISAAKAEEPELYAALANDYRAILPGGEDYDKFKERVLRAFYRLYDQEQGVSFMLVTHGGPLRCVLREVVGLPEIVKLEDCAYIEIDRCNDVWEVGKHQGIVWADD